MNPVAFWQGRADAFAQIHRYPLNQSEPIPFEDPIDRLWYYRGLRDGQRVRKAVRKSVESSRKAVK